MMWALAEIQRMNATKARERAKSNAAKGPDIRHLLDVVEKKINAAVNNGEFETGDPFAGLRTLISDEQRKAVWANLRSRGFVVRIGKRLLISWKEAPKR